MTITTIERVFMAFAGILMAIGVRKGWDIDAYISDHPWQFLFFIGLLMMMVLLARWIWRKHAILLVDIRDKLIDVEKAIKENGRKL